MKLTLKQQKFADEYIKTGNVYQSAKNAGYSENYAKGNSVKLLENVSVSEYIENRMAELKSKAIADQTEVLEYLTSVMRREKKEIVVVTLTKEESKWVDGKKQTVKTEVPELVEIPAKLSDANKAAELLGKRYKLFTDKQEVEVTTPTIINDIPLDD
ncbi:terminase small subunit [Macrococcoides canis]|uniref:terminase small subunit n=1 Tax=Macrococcoides canis TaxID=1855823 RepID=UPI00207CD048|nr:terminase small subunit [Macrococcus canis]MCO4095720.1 terminase small subunit [Macrococcus canis]UTH08429.1 terminase small subunit [Macrococcus canis]